MLTVVSFLSKKMPITAIIPAHLNSIRLPGKILIDIHGLPMIEHVRRRALMSELISNVYVATCDEQIKQTVEFFGGNVIMTSKKHKNGTSRVTEAINSLDIDKIMLLQGDEPLILPRHIDKIISIVEKDGKYDAWNATGHLEVSDDLLKKSFGPFCRFFFLLFLNFYQYFFCYLLIQVHSLSFCKFLLIHHHFY